MKLLFLLSVQTRYLPPYTGEEIDLAGIDMEDVFEALLVGRAARGDFAGAGCRRRTSGT